MPYYHSYIEFKGHAALMLSEQKDPSQPTQIICDVGFAYTLGDAPATGLRGDFTTHKGEVRNEDIASRALYSRTIIKHRTYEISQAEMKKFYSLLNTDVGSRKIRIETDEELEPESIKVIDDPAYQRRIYNCKTFVMNIMKEVGIIDASE